MSSNNAFLEMPLMLYSAARTTSFTLQFQLLRTIGAALPFSSKLPPPVDMITDSNIRNDLLGLLREDARKIASGLYPAQVLKPESPMEHMLRIPRILVDGLSIYKRRSRGRTTEFTQAARELLPELPSYYRRNFHFQTDGYLSEHSADLYEHQVEMLFRGSADAMRRLVLTPLREHFGSVDGKGLRFLEIGAGTGRATRFVHLAFPKARIVATDLSEHYLKMARRRLAEVRQVDFLQADGGHLPFSSGTFDAVYSVFMFHELPLTARRAVIQEARRVLKPRGFLGIVDSIQKGDKPIFDPLLMRFPQEYHEPFFRDYTARPLEHICRSAGFRGIRTDTGFFSKCVAGLRAA